MKILQELLQLNESIVTLPKVTSLDDLKEPKTGKYYTGIVNVIGNVSLVNKKLSKLPVKFGKVGGYFSCSDNELISLEGAPSSVGGVFYCGNNQLTALEGAPSSVGSDFSCHNNQLTSLDGIHKIIKKIDGGFWCSKNPIRSGGIGLLLIESLNEIIPDQPALKIIEKYLGQGKKGLLLCQNELIDAGYEEYARL